MSLSRWSPWKGWVAPLMFIPSPAAAADELGPICADRPAKANSVCTVPASMVQLEATAVGWSLTKVAGVESKWLTLGSSIAKFGLSAGSDIEVGFTPFAQVTTRAGGDGDRVSGFGDLVFRYKQRLTGTAAKLQVAAIPYVKLPTAGSGLGNGKVEGGIAVPISLTLGNSSLTLGPEADLVTNAQGHGRHVAIVNSVNIATPLASRLTGVMELWSNLNLDPTGIAKQVSADVALSYGLTRDVQLDLGANAGLTNATPDIEAYAGVAVRF